MKKKKKIWILIKFHCGIAADKRLEILLRGKDRVGISSVQLQLRKFPPSTDSAR